ncbi:MAG: cupin domain-containing protein [Methylophilaceae bacterium]
MKSTNLALSTLAIICGLSSATAFAEDAKMEVVPAAKMQVLPGAKNTKLPSMKVEGTNAYLKDIVHNANKTMPLTCGLFRMEKGGKDLVYTYEYDEAKIIISGTMNVSDGFSKAKLKAGDVVYFPKGATITFSSDSQGVGFICGNREFGGA